MQETLQKYRQRIATGEINPLVRWNGEKTSEIFNPDDDSTPLSMLGFSAYRLKSEPCRFETRDRELAIVPVTGRFEVRVGPEEFKGQRDGGPFAALPGKSNACAIYVPADSEVEIAGTGEAICFSAPAQGSKPPAFVKAGDRPNLGRGVGLWYREVVTLFTPDDVSTVLVGGETYSPPGLWSGTPLHVHDKADQAAGESDHEEIYYHLARNTEGEWGPFGVQLLFDNQGLDKAYMIHNRDAFAIPGAAHPVVAGPNSDMLYVWALAGPSTALGMRDVPEFSYLKKAGEILERITQAQRRKPLTRDEFAKLVAEADLQPHQAHVLRMHLRQQGIEVEPA
jgi:5-deoxy-D-glucuronate isomerase